MAASGMPAYHRVAPTGIRFRIPESGVGDCSQRETVLGPLVRRNVARRLFPVRRQVHIDRRVETGHDRLLDRTPVRRTGRLASTVVAHRTFRYPNNRAMWRFEYRLPVKHLNVIRSSQLNLAMALLHPREQKRNHAKGRHAPGGASKSGCRLSSLLRRRSTDARVPLVLPKWLQWGSTKSGFILL